MFQHLIVMCKIVTYGVKVVITDACITGQGGHNRYMYNRLTRSILSTVKEPALVMSKKTKHIVQGGGGGALRIRLSQWFIFVF